jgi:cell division protein FtsI/penicillin-binding protein 2
MFASSAATRPVGVRWLEAGQTRRRRRRAPLRVLPFLVLAVIVAVGVGAFVFLRDRERTTDRQREAAARFAALWARGDTHGMWRLLSASAQRTYPERAFVASYRASDKAATVRSVKPGRVVGPQKGVVRLPVVVRTRVFGHLSGTLALPVRYENGAGRIDWTPHLRLPGLRSGEAVRMRVLRKPSTATVLDAAGHPLDATPSAATLALGMQKLYADRLNGRPGAQLRFGQRIVRQVKVRRGRSVHSTIRPSVQAAAVRALGNRLGGIAVIRPRTGDILGLAGLAVSGPQPPGSTFKMITASAALRAGIARPSSTYPIRTFAVLDGVKLRNAGGEACGGTLVNAFIVSCNSVYAPLGARLGARRLVQAAEAFGFNEQLKVPGFKPSTIPPPGQLKDSLAVGASAIGQNKDLATPLEMASVGATIGNHGVRARPRIARSDRVHRRRVIPSSVAAQVREMMIGVVRGGTGTAAALPGVQVAGKTGTAELTNSPGGPTDAWFVAIAPADRPSVAVGVMLVNAGAGGTAAAPMARQVLESLLG